MDHNKTELELHLEEFDELLELSKTGCYSTEYRNIVEKLDRLTALAMQLDIHELDDIEEVMQVLTQVLQEHYNQKWEEKFQRDLEEEADDE